MGEGFDAQIGTVANGTNYGFDSELVDRSDFRTLAKWLRMGVPVIVDWMSTISSGRGRAAMACGHYSVVCGLIVPSRPFVEALTFSTSWFHTHQWVFEHSWSLSVEEAFYLLWPLTLTMLRHRGRVILALAVIAAGPVIRGLLYNLYGGDEYFARFSLGLLGNVDPIMWGCLLALIRHRHPALLERLGSWRPLVLHPWGALIMVALIRLNQPAFWHLTIPFTVTVSCLSICYLVNYHCFVSRGFGFRLLNHPWVVRIGILSYSIYLWQQLFLHPDKTAAPRQVHHAADRSNR